jgi:hypothetical protein
VRVYLRSLSVALAAVVATAVPLCALAQAAQSAESPDGSHDFDFNLGVWKTHIKRLVRASSGCIESFEMDGTVTVRKVWDGRAQLEEIEADGPRGHWESLTLFLYNPASRQWSINFANSRDGTLSQPAIGEFSRGRGEFYDQELIDGRATLVRIVWSDITPETHHFEQSLSHDGGRSWEPNFEATLTRLARDTTDETRAPVGPMRSTTPAAAAVSGQRDFDWQIGGWKIRMSRLQQPLSASTTWTELTGTVVVQKVWEGRANLAEITADGPSGHLEFLSLRLFNPQSHQWSLNFASSSRGTLSTPMVGEFHGGRGEFYDQESFKGRMILVRFVFADIGTGSSRDEQAFSQDGGKTWETNWVNRQTRELQ